jgi:hypothetical protein
VLGENDLRTTPAPEGVVVWQVAGTGPGAHELLLVTAESGPAAVLLAALQRVMAVAAPDRSLMLAITQEGELPDLPVAARVHLDYREGDRVEFSVRPCRTGALPLWLHQAAQAALAAEGARVGGGVAAELQRLSRSRARAGPPPSVTMQGVGLDDIDLLTLGQAAERLLIALDELPSLPEPRWWAPGRSASVYLLAGGRYASGPVMGIVQLTWLIPLLAGVFPGVRRPAPQKGIHLQADDGAILKMVHDYRLRQGRIPSPVGRRRVDRRLKVGGGLARVMAGEVTAGLLAAGALLLGAGAFRSSLTAVVAGLLALLAVWPVKNLAAGKAPDWAERHRALQALLVLAAITLTGWTGGHPLILLVLLPALLAWPALAPGRPARNCLLAALGASGGMLVAGLYWPGVLEGPGAPALLVMGSLVAVVFRLALARNAGDDGEGFWRP